MDLKPGGRDIVVTEENKEEYVELVVNWRVCKRVDEQYKAFQQGFHELVPPELVAVFDDRELELLIGGIAEIDVDDWKKHTDYRGYQEPDEVIGWFWKVRETRRLCRFLDLRRQSCVKNRGTNNSSLFLSYPVHISMGF